MLEPLYKIWKANKFNISLIYVLNILEELCFLFIPTAVGSMIDSFIYKKGYGVVAFALCYIGWQGLSLIRRIQDTKVFTEILNKLSLDMISFKNEEKYTTALINARIVMMKDVVNFFERDLPFLIRSLISIVGSAFLLYFYNDTLLVISLVVVIPSLLINYYNSSRIQKAASNLNDHFETQIDVIENGSSVEHKEYFNKLRSYNIKKSNLEAYNFTLIECFVFIMIISCIYVICNTDKMDYGDIVASYGIILRFAYGFDFLPHITSTYASLKDIIQRMEKE
jgi:ABC-type bacteriocin/lantibiotic exporter with double-glycine peptidase domain